MPAQDPAGPGQPGGAAGRITAALLGLLFPSQSEPEREIEL